MIGSLIFLPGDRLSKAWQFVGSIPHIICLPISHTVSMPSQPFGINRKQSAEFLATFVTAQTGHWLLMICLIVLNWPLKSMCMGNMQSQWEMDQHSKQGLRYGMGSSVPAERWWNDLNNWRIITDLQLIQRIMHQMDKSLRNMSEISLYIWHPYNISCSVSIFITWYLYHRLRPSHKGLH